MLYNESIDEAIDKKKEAYMVFGPSASLLTLECRVEI